MLTFNSKLPHVGTTIFAQMSQLAQQYQALNLAQGFPDFSAPEPLLAALGKHALAGHNQYAPLAGLPELREQVAAKIARLYCQSVSAEQEVTITPGATEAIFCAIQAFVGAGDEVLVFDPCYDSYEPSVQLAGGHCIHLPLRLPEFQIDWQLVAKAITPRTRMIILNSPHNPSGAVISHEELLQLTELVRDTNIIILSDEVYEHLVFDGAPHQSVLGYEELYARSCVVSSFGKTYHVTGWKTGYIVAPAKLTEEIRKVHQFVNFCGVTPVQYALADFMRAHPEHVDELPAFYQQKRDHLCQLLKPSRFKWVPTQSTYFQLLDYSAIQPTFSDLQMTEWLVKECGIAAIPLSVFYQQPPAEQRLIRICFDKQTHTLDQAGALLCQI